MSEITAQPPDPNEALRDALSKVARIFEYPMPRLRDEAACAEIAYALDAVLNPFARGRGALDVAIGEGLDALGKGNLVLRLGYSGVPDYAREELGLNASTAQKMIRFARNLRERPLLRDAVRAGEVSVRQAEAVMPVAVGDAERSWVERARRGETVRSLRAQVKDHVGQEPEEDEEEWGVLCAQLSPGARATVDEAMELAGQLLGANAPRQQRIEAMCQEYAGAHGAPDDAGAASSGPVRDWMGPAKGWLEDQAERWAFLSRLGPIAAPWADPDAQRDPFLLHDELWRLVERRVRWDEDFGHLAMLFRQVEGWGFLDYASFGQYCEERLGMCERAVQQRAALERRLYDLPSLRQAMCEGRISYEKARLIARHADEDSVEEWIERAAGMTCIRLRRALEGAEDRAQMCARGTLRVPMTLRVLGLVAVAFRAARKEAGRWIPPGECLRLVAEHFIATWGPALAGRRTLQKEILARDRGLCQVPGCSRAAMQVHHVRFRSAGGGDEEENLVALCAAHHLQCVHNGWVRVTGKAPDQLRWELGVRPGRPPFREVVGRPAG